MNNNNNVYEDSFPKYTFGITINIILGILLGVLTDNLINYFQKTYNLNFYVAVIIQIIIVTLVIFTIKKLSKHIHQEPQTNYSYDIIFVSIYLGSQGNFQELINKLKTYEHN